MSGRWFPKFDPTGRHLASGDVEILVDDVVFSRSGIAPVWRDAQTVLWRGQEATPGVWLRRLDEPDAHLLDATGANTLAAGGGFSATWRPDRGILPSWPSPRVIDPGDGRRPLNLNTAGEPSLSPDGVFLCVDPYQSIDRTLYVANVPIAAGAITASRASRTAVVWQLDDREVWGYAVDDPRPRRLWAVGKGNGRAPIPIDTPDGPWVLVSTSGGYFVAPLGAETGIVVDNGGQTFYPDAIFVDGAIAVAFTNAACVLDIRTHRLTDPRFPVPRQAIDPVVCF